MTQIEITNQAGDVERRPLDRSTPLCIGSHFSNDLCIEEEGVGVLHCRISWNGKAFEVTAGGPGGVDVNGNMVQHAPLANGSLLRIGSVDIVYRGEERSRTASRRKPQDEEIGLQQVTDDEIPVLKRATDVAREMGGSSGPRKRTEPEPPAETFPAPKKPASNQHAAATAKPEPQRSEEASDAGQDSLEFADIGDLPLPGRDKGKQKQSAFRSLKERMSGPPTRPGEQDVTRSPLVLTLGGSALALLLAALTVWLIIGRETAQKHYDAALNEFNAGNYQQAAALFESFVDEHPRHSLAEEARYGLGKSKIQMALSGAAPKWSRGLEELQSFVQQHRERPRFESQVEALRKFARTIAFGAAKNVEASAKRPSVQPDALTQLLDVSRAAGTELGRLYPPDDQPAELQGSLADAQWKAEQAIATRTEYLAAVAEIERAIQARESHKAFAARNALVTANDFFSSDARLSRLLEQTLEVEKSLVAIDDVDRRAVTDEREPNAAPPLSFVRHTYSGTGEKSVGRTVFAVSKDCCYGIDSVTGKPLWRRAIGRESPFFPLAVDTSTSGVLLFDTRFDELLLLDRRTGKLVWRQPLEEDLVGEPLLHEGRAYAATVSGRLYQIVLDSGLVTKRLTFSQPLIARPVLVRNNSQLVAAGRSSVLYTLSVRPLECTAVSFSGHAAGAVATPLLTMGSLVLVTENNNINTSRLRVFDTRLGEQTLKPIAAESVAGRILNRPAIRGKQLFVTSSPEQITAFAVSEEKEQPPLLRVAETRITGAYHGPLYLQAGPDGRLWMAGSAFRSFRLLTDAIAYDEAKRTAVGITSQPLQLIDRYFYVGRRQPYHRALLFTPVEREQLTSHWGTLLGAAPIAMLAADGNLVCVTETGDVFRAGEDDLRGGGFVMRAVASLPVAAETTSPLIATRLTNQLLAVAAAGPEPMLWLIDSSGRIVRETPLPQPLEAAPVAIEAGIVLPLPGRLSLLQLNGPLFGSNSRPAEDYPAPLVDGKRAKWRHLVGLNDDEFFAVNESGRLSRMQFRNTDVPHIAEVDAVVFAQPIDVSPVVAGDYLFVADASGGLTSSSLSSLEVVSEVTLPAPATNRLWFVDGALHVESGRRTFECFSVDEGRLQSEWKLPLEGTSIAGPPLAVGGRLLVALEDGKVLTLEGSTGKPVNRAELPQPAAAGPLRVGNVLVVPTADGSLHSVAAVAGAAGERRPGE